MSVQDLLSPYVNRFTLLHQQKASAILEFSYSNGKINVNLKHDLGEVKVPSPQTNLGHPAYRDVVKKNKSLSQINRLQRRAKARAEESHNAPTSIVNDDSEKETPEAEQKKLEAEKARFEAEKAGLETKLKSALQEAIDFKAEAEQAKTKIQIANKEAVPGIKEAEQAKDTNMFNELELEKASDNINQSIKVSIEGPLLVDLNKTLYDLEDPQSDNSDYEDISFKEVKPNHKGINNKNGAKSIKRKLQIKFKSSFKPISSKDTINEKCELCQSRTSSKYILKKHYVMTHPNSISCDFCQCIFIDMKHIRRHFASDHSSEYNVADITSVTTNCQEFVVDMDI